MAPMVPFTRTPVALPIALALECEAAAGDLRLPLAGAHYALRRRLKVLRAWLRLYPLEDESLRLKERSLWRGHGQALAAGREREALAEALVKLRARFPDELPSAVWDRHEAALRTRQLPLSEARRKLLLRDLSEAAARYRAWPEPAAEEVAAAFATSVRRAWKQARLARDGGEPEAHHELRKRVKTIVLQLRQHRDGTPGADFRLARKLKRVTDLLGDAQDLDALKAEILKFPRRFPGEAGRTRLIDLAHRRARKLEAKGLALACKRLKKLRRKVAGAAVRKAEVPKPGPTP